MNNVINLVLGIAVSLSIVSGFILGFVMGFTKKRSEYNSVCNLLKLVIENKFRIIFRLCEVLEFEKDKKVIKKIFSRVEESHNEEYKLLREVLVK